jgi:hypothetical protein
VRDDQPGRIEVVEFGGSGPGRAPGRPWPSWLPRWLPTRWPPKWVLVALAAVVAVAALAYVRNGKSPSASPTHPSAVASPSPSGGPAPDVPTPPAVRVTELGVPLLGVTGGWELFGRGLTSVVRIELARGRITETAVPGLSSGGPVSFIVGTDRAIVRPLDFVPGYAVPDGQAAQPLSAELSSHGPALPGPDPDTVWVPTGDADHPKMILVDLLGRPTGPSIALPYGNYGYGEPDGTGYVFVGGPGGTYLARPDGMRRVSTGVLVATGPSHLLAVECDDRYRCATVVINRGTGARRVIDTRADLAGGTRGVISANGAFAAMLESDTLGTTRVRLLDLASGTERQLGVPVNRSFQDSTMVWSPDSRWLFIATADGGLTPVDPATGQVYDIGATLPELRQLAVRPAPPRTDPAGTGGR